MFQKYFMYLFLNYTLSLKAKPCQDSYRIRFCPAENRGIPPGICSFHADMKMRKAGKREDFCDKNARTFACTGDIEQILGLAK